MICFACKKVIDGPVKHRSIRKWVSFGPAPMLYPNAAFHPECFGPYVDERAKFYAVLDETMNTHKHFVRVKGQRGYYIKGSTKIPCAGWQTAAEVGVPYEVHGRYKDYF